MNLKRSEFRCGACNALGGLLLLVVGPITHDHALDGLGIVLIVFALVWRVDIWRERRRRQRAVDA